MSSWSYSSNDKGNSPNRAVVQQRANKLFGQKWIPNRELGPSNVPLKSEVKLRSPKKLQESKREHLQAMLEREKEKDRNGRIITTLSRKLIDKHGMKHANIIAFFVEEHVTSNRPLDEKNIEVLGKEIADAVSFQL